ncbi:hypothetical protein JTE90_002728 [Oedothorax gibbosus]|uniref:Rho-GAP domain-containing protein n=1 Tax=Oedothorax gibbosus TaxID=931172 RepID=A0AAV6VYB0_9ARAC|nr:hypothetical protein JTE90_002728 [Oedothorax gibbosus]
MMKVANIAFSIIPRLQGTIVFSGVLSDETENNNAAKWTLSAMERYMRDRSEGSVALGLVSQPPLPKQRSPKHPPINQEIHTPPTNQQYSSHPPANTATEAQESAGEETSPSWASSSTGGNNTPSYGSNGVTFEFNNDNSNVTPTTPVITTTGCTPHSTPKKGSVRSSSADLLKLDSLEQGLELSLSKPGGRRSRKDSEDSVKSGGKGGTPTKTSKLRKLLRRTHSAGCSKDAQDQGQYVKGKTVSFGFVVEYLAINCVFQNGPYSFG